MSDVRRFRLPDLGEGLTEAEVVAWLVAPGDTVAVNQALLEVETEKATVELPSPFAGTVVELSAEPGETVPVGAALVAIEVGDRAGESGRTAQTDRSREVGPTDETDHADETDRVPMLVGYGPAAARPSRRRRRTGDRSHRTSSVPPPPASRPLAAPPVRFMARQHGVDLADVAGHGPGGVITREDLAAYLASTTDATTKPTTSLTPPPTLPPAGTDQRGRAPFRAGCAGIWPRRWCAVWPPRRRPVCS